MHIPSTWLRVLRIVGAVLLVIVVLYVIAVLYFIGQLGNDPYGNGRFSIYAYGHLELSPSRPTAVQRFRIRVEPRDGSPVAQVDLRIDAEDDALAFTVVRVPEGIPVELGPSTRDQPGAMAVALPPLACDPQNGCRDEFEVRFRLIGSTSVSADWWAFLIAQYKNPVGRPEDVEIEIIP